MWPGHPPPPHFPPFFSLLLLSDVKTVCVWTLWRVACVLCPLCYQPFGQEDLALCRWSKVILKISSWLSHFIYLHRSCLSDFSDTNFILITWVVPKLWLFKYLIYCPNLSTKCKWEQSWDLRSYLEAILHITCLIFRNLILHSTNNRPNFL